MERDGQKLSEDKFLNGYFQINESKLPENYRGTASPLPQKLFSKCTIPTAEAKISCSSISKASIISKKTINEGNTGTEWQRIRHINRTRYGSEIQRGVFSGLCMMDAPVAYSCSRKWPCLIFSSSRANDKEAKLNRNNRYRDQCVWAYFLGWHKTKKFSEAFEAFIASSEPLAAFGYQNSSFLEERFYRTKRGRSWVLGLAVAVALDEVARWASFGSSVSTAADAWGEFLIHPAHFHIAEYPETLLRFITNDSLNNRFSEINGPILPLHFCNIVQQLLHNMTELCTQKKIETTRIKNWVQREKVFHEVGASAVNRYSSVEHFEEEEGDEDAGDNTDGIETVAERKHLAVSNQSQPQNSIQKGVDKATLKQKEISLGSRVSVYWPKDCKTYAGIVCGIIQKIDKPSYEIVYDIDGSFESDVMLQRISLLQLGGKSQDYQNPTALPYALRTKISNGRNSTKFTPSAFQGGHKLKKSLPMESEDVFQRSCLDSSASRQNNFSSKRLTSRSRKQTKRYQPAPWEDKASEHGKNNAVVATASRKIIKGMPISREADHKHVEQMSSRETTDLSKSAHSDDDGRGGNSISNKTLSLQSQKETRTSQPESYGNKASGGCKRNAKSTPVIRNSVTKLIPPSIEADGNQLEDTLSRKSKTVCQSGCSDTGPCQGNSFSTKRQSYRLRKQGMILKRQNEEHQAQTTRSVKSVAEELLKAAKEIPHPQFRLVKVSLIKGAEGLMMNVDPDGDSLRILGFRQGENGQMGVAERSGKILKGDVLIKVNGMDITKMDNSTALDFLFDAQGKVDLVLRRESGALQEEAQEAEMNTDPGENSDLCQEIPVSKVKGKIGRKRKRPPSASGGNSLTEPSQENLSAQASNKSTLNNHRSWGHFQMNLSIFEEDEALCKQSENQTSLCMPMSLYATLVHFQIMKALYSEEQNQTHYIHSPEYIQNSRKSLNHIEQSQPHPRQKCERCSKWNVVCDLKYPTCGRCKSLDMACTYIIHQMREKNFIKTTMDEGLTVRLLEVISCIKAKRPALVWESANRRMQTCLIQKEFKEMEPLSQTKLLHEPKEIKRALEEYIGILKKHEAKAKCKLLRILDQSQQGPEFFSHLRKALDTLVDSRCKTQEALYWEQEFDGDIYSIYHTHKNKPPKDKDTMINITRLQQQLLEENNTKNRARLQGFEVQEKLIILVAEITSRFKAHEVKKSVLQNTILEIIKIYTENQDNVHGQLSLLKEFLKCRKSNHDNHAVFLNVDGPDKINEDIQL